MAYYFGGWSMTPECISTEASSPILPVDGREAAAETEYDVRTILQSPDALCEQTVHKIVHDLSKDQPASDRALAALTAVLLLVPDLGKHVPLSLLDRLSLDEESQAWQHLAILLMHSGQAEKTFAWLQDRLTEGLQCPAKLVLEHISDWFPDRLDTPILERLMRQDHSASPDLAVIFQRHLFRRKIEAVNGFGKSVLSQLFSQSPRLLVIHNIVDGLGDEMMRVFALLQAMLDGFSNLEITVFTDRMFLYDHPRVTAISISDKARLSQLLASRWDGVINFFEPYLAANSYDVAVQELLRRHFEQRLPRFVLSARKDLNNFVFESLILDGREFASAYGFTKRQLPLNYHTAMRLIAGLGLPLRVGEQKPRGGFVAAANPQPEIAATWQTIRQNLTASGHVRAIAVVNVFGGQSPKKGFAADSFSRLAQVLHYLVDEGYGLLLIPNGYGWGGAREIEAIRDLLPPEIRECTMAVPIVADAGENMRRFKYFVAWSDLVVTIEGWMMHLAYALGKPYRLLMAPYSGGRQWHPHGLSANQGLWIPPVARPVRSEFALSSASPQAQRLCVHYPEKALLASALSLWSLSGDRQMADLLACFMLDDSHIRSWVVAARAAIDPLHARDELLAALADRNHEVRAAAATALLESGQELSQALSADWRQMLEAYELIGACRYQDAGALGKAALPALTACLDGDEEQVGRDARVMLELLTAQ